MPSDERAVLTCTRCHVVVELCAVCERADCRETICYAPLPTRSGRYAFHLLDSGPKGSRTPDPGRRRQRQAGTSFPALPVRITEGISQVHVSSFNLCCPQLGIRECMAEQLHCSVVQRTL